MRKIYTKSPKSLFNLSDKWVNSSVQIRAFCFILLFAFSAVCAVAQVKINELMASNLQTITDNAGEYSDWVELYNPTGVAIDLAGYYLTDDYANKTKFRFTTATGQVVVPANGYLVIWASGTVAEGPNHASFSLSASGEELALVMPDGLEIADSLTFSAQRTDVSYGRLPNGGTGLKYFATPTPGSANSAGNSYNELLSPPVFSQAGGFYSQPFDLTISHNDPGVTVIYTTDGSVPAAASLTPQSYEYRNEYPGSSLTNTYRSYVYANPLPVADATSTPNKVSMIASTHSQGLGYLPANLIYKAKIVRAIATKPGALSSEITSSSFFYSATGTNKYTLPVVSIMSQEDGFFSYNNGIYVPGIDFDNWRIANPGVGPDTDNPANYRREGEATERSSHFEIIEDQNVVYKQDVGIRIHGGWSRGYRFKSLRLYGTDQYKTIESPLFPNLPYATYKTFILRNSGNDYNSTLFKDAFMHESVSHTSLDIQAYRPSILFLNGEYWGIHNMRQRQDKHYYSQKYGVDADNLDVLGTEVDEGDANHYNAMLNYINVNSVTNATHYNYIKTQMVTENFIDYQITEIFYNNWDWGLNNIKYWRLRVPYNATAPVGHDGRWRWSLYDLDHGMTNPTENRLSIASTIGSVSSAGFLLGKMLQNLTFRNDFINRFADMLNTAFLPARLTQLVEAKRDGISAEIPAHLDRWKTLANSTDWLTQINNCLTFIQQRPTNQRTHIRSKFGLSGQYNLTVSVSNAAHGYVRVNTIDILPSTPGVSASPYPWTGIYFAGVPIQLTAQGKPGYKFKHWSYNAVIDTNSVLTVNSTVAVSYTAVFEESILSANPIPTAADLDICGYNFSAWPALSTTGTTPSHMKFVYMVDSDPEINSAIAGFTSGAYNLTSRTRINGLEENGISFVNTGNAEGNPGYPGMKLGGAILALNTEGKEELSVKWTGRTLALGVRQYAIRLQYRIGDIVDFADLLDENNQIIEYNRGTTAGDSAVFEVKLPATLLNQPYVQLLWRYYRKNGTSDNRDELGIDDIVVESKRVLSGTTTAGVTEVKEGVLISTVTVGSSSNVLYEAKRSIQLNPGFNTAQQAIFKAQINGCP